MKHLKKIFIAAALVLVAMSFPLLSAAKDKKVASSTEAKPIVLKFASYMPEINTIAKYNIWWAKEIEKRTNGRVAFDFYWAASLVKAPNLATATSTGICDVALFATGYTRAKFPITGIYEPLYVTQKPDAACRAMSELLETEDIFRAEWEKNNLRLLFFDMLPPNVFGFKKKVSNLEELRGLKIRTSGSITQVTKRLGATAVSISSSEIYEALDRGLIDGYTNTSLASAATRSYPEVAPYILDPGMGNYACIETAMNLNTWNNLPADIKQIILEVSKEVIDKSAEIMMEDEDKMMQKMHTDWKTTFYTLSPEEAERWKAIVLPLYDEYIKNFEAKGLPGKKLFGSYKALAKKHEKESVYTSAYERWVKKYGK
jgi:TRAP-type transport system periplasmic protein